MKWKISILLVSFCFLVKITQPQDPVPTEILILEQLIEQKAILLEQSGVQKEEALVGKKDLLETIKGFTILKDIKKIQDDIAEAMKDLDILTKIETIKSLEILFERILCTSYNYEFYLGMSINHSNCMFDFNTEIIKSKISISKDLLFAAFGGVKLMTQWERINSIKDAIDALNEAFIEMDSFNKRFEVSLNQYLVERYIKKMIINSYQI